MAQHKQKFLRRFFQKAATFFLRFRGIAPMQNPTPKRRVIHPWPLRVMHWLNAIAIVVMIGSGWQIYNASPLFGVTFPRVITIGDWLGAAIAWHLAFMWLLGINGLVYVVWKLASGHYRKFLPLSPASVLRDLRAALQFQLKHEPGMYNAVQKLLYLGVLFAGLVAVLSGLAIWKPVQLWPLSDLFGGFVTSRYVHFFAMAAIVAFFAIHLTLVALVPKVLPPMITGGRQES
jgi:thiosulfate reductase cytochrome b subunit